MPTTRHQHEPGLGDCTARREVSILCPKSNVRLVSDGLNAGTSTHYTTRSTATSIKTKRQSRSTRMTSRYPSVPLTSRTRTTGTSIPRKRSTWSTKCVLLAIKWVRDADHDLHRSHHRVPSLVPWGTGRTPGTSPAQSASPAHVTWSSSLGVVSTCRKAKSTSHRITLDTR